MSGCETARGWVRAVGEWCTVQETPVRDETLLWVFWISVALIGAGRLAIWAVTR